MAWPKATLRDVLTPIERPEAPLPGTVYRQLGVRLWGEGAYERESIDGAATKYSTLSRMEADDVVVNKIWARNGSVAVVQTLLAGCYVSGEFPTFTVNVGKLSPRWMHWLTKTPDFWSQCDEKSRGTSGKNRIKPEQFLSVEIPLPPLAEQRRIVARIEALAAKIAEARSLRQQAIEEVEAIVLSLLHRFFVAGTTKWKSISMDQAIEINDKQVDPTLPEHSQLPHISGENMESRTCRLLPWRTADADGVKSNNYLFSPGTILYSKIRPYLRKAVFVDFRGVCSADVYPIRVRNSGLDPHFVKWALVAEPFTNYANRLSGRTRMPKLNRKQLFGFEFFYPPIHEQRRIVSELQESQAKVDALKRLQTETAAELDALLPAVLDRAFKGELLSAELVPSIVPMAAEAPPTKHSRGLFYRRAAIDAYIVNALQDDRNLGRTKLEKISHLLEYHCGVNLEREPLRDAAGPIDNVSRRKVESLAVKQHWYSVKEAREHWGMRVSYTPGPKIADALAYAKKTLGAHHSSVDDLIVMLRPLDTKQSEIIATLYAAWNDLLLTGKSPTDDEIVIEAREHWHPSKQEISVDRWVNGLRWLRHSGLIPRGTGKPVCHLGG